MELSVINPNVGPLNVGCAYSIKSGAVMIPMPIPIEFGDSTCANENIGTNEQRLKIIRDFFMLISCIKL